MADFNIDRINELYKKSKEVGLSPEEKEEQDRLRKAYVASFRNNLRGQLDNMKIQHPDGSIENVKDRRKDKDNE
ncbi:MAG: DUF896 domain-containing protein [Clostridiales bacterium]|nr:DUF896 domain-containing protein [Clostridiales bacterium]